MAFKDVNLGGIGEVANVYKNVNAPIAQALVQFGQFLGQKGEDIAAANLVKQADLDNFQELLKKATPSTYKTALDFQKIGINYAEMKSANAFRDAQTASLVEKEKFYHDHGWDLAKLSLAGMQPIVGPDREIEVDVPATESTDKDMPIDETTSGYDITGKKLTGGTAKKTITVPGKVFFNPNDINQMIDQFRKSGVFPTAEAIDKFDNNITRTQYHAQAAASREEVAQQRAQAARDVAASRAGAKMDDDTAREKLKAWARETVKIRHDAAAQSKIPFNDAAALASLYDVIEGYPEPGKNFPTIKADLNQDLDRLAPGTSIPAINEHYKFENQVNLHTAKVDRAIQNVQNLLTMNGVDQDKYANEIKNIYAVITNTPVDATDEKIQETWTKYATTLAAKSPEAAAVWGKLNPSLLEEVAKNNIRISEGLAPKVPTEDDKAALAAWNAKDIELKRSVDQAKQRESDAEANWKAALFSGEGDINDLKTKMELARNNSNKAEEKYQQHAQSKPGQEALSNPIPKGDGVSPAIGAITQFIYDSTEKDKKGDIAKYNLWASKQKTDVNYSLYQAAKALQKWDQIYPKTKENQDGYDLMRANAWKQIQIAYGIK